MIIYNVTLSIDRDIEQQWLQWMKEIHIPEVMATGCFIENKLLRMLDQEEEGGLTYASQYLCVDMPTYERYQKEFAPALQKSFADKYSGKFAAFRTILDVLQISQSN